MIDLSFSTFFNKIFAFNVVTSTNDMALKYCENSDESGLIFIANEQEAGKGRQGKSWIGKKGQFYASFYLAKKDISQLNLLSMAIPIALHKALLYLGVKSNIKWPNDIVTFDKNFFSPYFGSYRKISGILIENIFVGEQFKGSVIGVGINLVEDEVIKNNVIHADFIERHTHTKIDKKIVLANIIKEIDNILITMGKNSCEISDCYMDIQCVVGYDIEFMYKDKKICAKIVSITDEGFLVVSHEKKNIILKSVSDVSFVF